MATVDTMIKTIRLSAQLRTVAGAKTVDVVVPHDGTVRDLLRGLFQTNEPLASHILDDAGGLNSGIQVLVGGRHIDFLQGLDTPLAGTNDLMIIPPLSGG